MPRSLSLAIVPLAIAETLVWAAYYYSFPAFLPMWEADFGWSRAEISGAFTAALILTGVLAPRAGRLVDRGWSREAFLGSTAAGAVLLVLLSQVTELWQFWAVWLALGVVNAACLYETCFAILTVTLGAEARRAITMVTLFAGFAGTVSFPSAYLLSEWFDWRSAMLIFAGVSLLVSLPLAALGLHLLGGHAESAADKPALTGTEAQEARRKPAFWYMGVAFATIGIIHGMIISHIRPIMEDRGLVEAMAVTIASMIGPMQVLGRVVMIAVQHRVGIFGAAVGCYLGIIVGLVALLGAWIAPWLMVFVYVVPYGAAYGVVSIVRPVLTADLLGRAGFGVIAGMLAVPYMLGFAAGPTLGAGLWEIGGYDLVLALAAGLAVLGLGALILARRAG